MSFYKVLVEAVPEGLYVTSKVRISDVLAVRKGLDRSRRQVAQNKINAKHVDFVLCNSADMTIVAAIELDDSSHNRADRKKRDLFVNAAFKSAGVDLIRFKVKREYSLEEIAAEIKLRLQRTDRTPELKRKVTSGSSTTSKPLPVENLVNNDSGPHPDCPKCGASMLKRQAKRGELKGKEFWGCSTFPKCRGVLPIA